jgi:hypothetical protein
MKVAFASAVLLAAGLAGCGAMTPTPSDTRNDKEAPLPPGQGMFGDNATWEWRKKSEQAASTPAAPMSAAEQEEFKKWRESASSSERKDFEDWRAWQEWKKKNPQ